MIIRAAPNFSNLQNIFASKNIKSAQFASQSPNIIVSSDDNIFILHLLTLSVICSLNVKSKAIAIGMIYF
jgi:hypothetical protein